MPRFFSMNFWRRAHGPGAPNFHYNTWPTICQEKSCTNFVLKKIPILCNITTCILCALVLYYNHRGELVKLATKPCRVREEVKPKVEKKILKKSKKGLDKLPNVCYN